MIATAAPRIRTGALVGLLVICGCSSGKPAPESTHRGPLGAIVALREHHGLLGQRGYSIGPIAASSRYVFWTAASGDEADVLLLRRDLRTSANRVLAHRLFQAFGLYTAAGSVIYATQSGTSAQLVSMGVSGGPTHILSRSLVAPFDARGEMVAWAEGDATHNRVLFQNLRTGRRALAFEGARCSGKRCYRIDRVTVAERGVVFDLGSVGQGYPSQIVRRAWRAPRPAFASVPNDPQPDLARSSSGALFYWLGHGWMQWDFGQAQPESTWPHGIRPWVLSREGPRTLVIGGATCAAGVAVRASGGKTIPIPPPGPNPVTTNRFGKLCRQVAGYSWSGNRLLLAWSLTPQVSVEAHEDFGAASVITTVVVH
jgi:hypothetical protein